MTSFVVNISETLQRSAAEDPVPDLHAAAGRDMEEIVVKEEEMIKEKRKNRKKNSVDHRMDFVRGSGRSSRPVLAMLFLCWSHRSLACLLALPLYKHLL
jgi:hypothetical protein